ncbi:MAG: hypothetical protein IPL47_03630 [Phyllobacteriaceae bacterium]|nr:hypothetical protein [Phyllobacteriaceae bacterium]
MTGAPTLTPAPKAVAAPPPAKTPAIEKPADTATLAPQEQKPGLTKETLPAVAPSPAEAPAIDKPVEMAALAPQEQKPGPSKETIPAADLPVVTDPDELRKETEKRQAFARLAGQAQQELARLGCFRSGSDGEWGAKSARALLRYYGAKKLEPDIVEPTEELVSRLKAETKVVCSNTETAKPKASQKKPATAPAAKKPAKAAPVASNSGGAPKKKAESAGQKKPSPPKSATEIKKKLTTKPIIGAF